MPNVHFLDDEARTNTVGRVVIIPVPYGSTVSWVGGTEHGPAAILEASATLENLDNELLIETCQVGIDTMAPVVGQGVSPTDMCRIVQQAVRTTLECGQLPVVLGGEHTVSLPAIEACRAMYPDVHVVQIDAHLDLRDQYGDDPLSHACVMRRVDDLGIPFTQIGIRSFCRAEWELVAKRGLTPFTMSRIHAETDWIEQVCREIKGPVYLTIDVDGLDPSVIPATGTPEPDGLSWRQLTSLVRGIAQHHRIIGFDCVELAPSAGLHCASFAAAKLVYRTLGYIFERELSGR